MNLPFYFTGLVAVAATLMVITRTNVVHALLYLVVSLLAVAVVFYQLGAPFVAVLEVIIYAGAIMVLFVFAVMMLNVDVEQAEQGWLQPSAWLGPGVLAAILLAELVYVLFWGPGRGEVEHVVGPRQVGLALYGPYLLAVELASFLLLTGLVGAYHLGRREPSPEEGDR